MAIVAGVLVSILVAITLATFGDLPVRIITPPAAAEYDISSAAAKRTERIDGGLRRLRACKSMTVRVALGAVYFALPVTLPVAVALLDGGSGST